MIEPKKKEPFLNTPVSQLHRTVTMKTTLGTIRIEMKPEWAPNHGRNFLMLTEIGWYNGTGFFRVAKGFVAQGGTSDSRKEDSRKDDADPPGERWVHNIQGEFRDDVKHERGIVSMARGDDPDSGGNGTDALFFPYHGSVQRRAGHRRTLFLRHFVWDQFHQPISRSYSSWSPIQNQ